MKSRAFIAVAMLALLTGCSTPKLASSSPEEDGSAKSSASHGNTGGKASKTASGSGGSAGISNASPVKNASPSPHPSPAPVASGNTASAQIAEPNVPNTSKNNNAITPPAPTMPTAKPPSAVAAVSGKPSSAAAASAVAGPADSMSGDTFRTDMKPAPPVPTMVDAGRGVARQPESDSAKLDVAKPTAHAPAVRPASVTLNPSDTPRTTTMPPTSASTAIQASVPTSRPTATSPALPAVISNPSPRSRKPDAALESSVTAADASRPRSASLSPLLIERKPTDASASAAAPANRTLSMPGTVAPDSTLADDTDRHIAFAAAVSGAAAPTTQPRARADAPHLQTRAEALASLRAGKGGRFGVWSRAEPNGRVFTRDEAIRAVEASIDTEFFIVPIAGDDAAAWRDALALHSAEFARTLADAGEADRRARTDKLAAQREADREGRRKLNDAVFDALLGGEPRKARAKTDAATQPASSR